MARRVEYVFGSQEPPVGHSLGIGALALVPDASLIISGDRAGRLDAWNTASNQAAQVAQVHTNTVTGLAYCRAKKRIISCSADTTVRLWDPVAGGAAHTLGHHTDYAQCVTTVDSSVVASGGLDSFIRGWDYEKGESWTFKAPSSVYALAAVPNIVVSGGHDGILRVWDVRSTRPVVKLAGHSDSIRNLAMTNAQQVLSASSDGTVRLWSLSTGRTDRMWTQHGDSVWSLYVDEDGSGFWSGDRAGNVWHSLLTGSAASTKICTEAAGAGIKALAFDGKALWTAAYTDPHVNKLMPTDQESWEVVHKTEGYPALRKHRLLNDKRRALVCDTEGIVCLVDLTTAKKIEEFSWRIPDTAMKNSGAMDDALDAILDEINTMDVLDNWCGVAIRAGKVCVTLEAQSISNADVYADQLWPNTAQDPEKRVMLGGWVLRSLLDPVWEDRRAAYAQLPDNEKLDEEAHETEPENGEEPQRRHFFSKLLGRRRKEKDDLAEAPASSGSHSSGSAPSGSAGTATTQPTSSAVASPTASAQEPVTFKDSWEQLVAMRSFKDEENEPPSLMDPNTRIVITEVAPGAGAPTEVWQGTVGGLRQDAKSIQKVLPGWVGEVIMVGKLPSARAAPNIGFTLRPYDSSFSSVDLPGIVSGKSRLVAVTQLRVRKVMVYVISQLHSLGLLMDEAQEAPPNTVVEIYCGDTAVDQYMTLATIRTRVWRNGGDVMLQFRILKYAK